MREQNKLSDPNMTMDIATHTYNLATHPELDFVSVTTFVSGFFRPFDKERIAKNLLPLIQDILEDLLNHLLRNGMQPVSMVPLYIKRWKTG